MWGVKKKKRRRNTEVRCSHKEFVLCNFPPQPASHLPLRRLPADWWLWGCEGSGAPSGRPTHALPPPPSRYHRPMMEIQSRDSAKWGEAALPSLPRLTHSAAGLLLLSWLTRSATLTRSGWRCLRVGRREPGGRVSTSCSPEVSMTDNGVQSLCVQGCSEHDLQPGLLFKAEHEKYQTLCRGTCSFIRLSTACVAKRHI